MIHAAIIFPYAQWNQQVGLGYYLLEGMVIIIGTIFYADRAVVVTRLVQFLLRPEELLCSTNCTAAVLTSPPNYFKFASTNLLKDFVAIMQSRPLGRCSGACRRGQDKLSKSGYGLAESTRPWRPPTRRFGLAFALYRTKFKAWVFNRSVPHSSASLEVHKDSGKFIQMIVGYAMMSAEELGLDVSRTHLSYFTSQQPRPERSEKQRLISDQSKRSSIMPKSSDSVYRDRCVEARLAALGG
ncbi:hypothetical protein I7I51_06487 [Histoplasma capsulatum]|uniref:Fungal-type protein kinase domain-containing protein n=1 Tax=Ajellomyces capsulatus TaxID=5037 RepID=A0A8A1MI00_AJECA|nr:hypothetical protein I7I51_06487 [Histoplasma capsulatum]